MQELLDRLEILIAAESIVSPDSIRIRGMLDLVQAIRDRSVTLKIRVKPIVQGQNDRGETEVDVLWRKA